MTKLEAIRELRNYDHCFLSPEGVKAFCEPFGIVGRTYKAKANPGEFKGLTLNDGMAEAEGQDAHKLACQIADHLGVKYPDMFGIGSQLRAACDAVEAHLQKTE